jgi:hypothetical protein
LSLANIYSLKQWREKTKDQNTLNKYLCENSNFYCRFKIENGDTLVSLDNYNFNRICMCKKVYNPEDNLIPCKHCENCIHVSCIDSLSTESIECTNCKNNIYIGEYSLCK